MTETKLRYLRARYNEAEAAAEKSRLVDPYSYETHKAFQLSSRRHKAFAKGADELFGCMFGRYARRDAQMDAFLRRMRKDAPVVGKEYYEAISETIQEAK